MTACPSLLCCIAWQKRSGEGVSRASLLAECIAYALQALKASKEGLPFAAYGETVLVLLQNVALLLSMAFFSQPSPSQAAAEIGLALALLASQGAGLLTGEVLNLLFSAQAVIILGSKVPQILSLLKSRSSGALSKTTIAMMSAGSAARIYTTYSYGGTPTMVVNYSIAFTLNIATLLLAVIFSPTPTSEKRTA